jgi:hypothetical protein
VTGTVLPPALFASMPRFSLKHLLLTMAVATVGVFVVANVTLDPLAPETDIRYYERHRSGFPLSLNSHFPVHAMSNAELFYYTPGQLQATEAMQLLVSVTATELDEMQSKFAAEAIDHFVQFDPTNPAKPGIKSANGYPQRVFSANNADCVVSVDDHYYVLFEGNGPEPAEAGVVINRTRRTVLYYCDVGKSTNLYD